MELVTRYARGVSSQRRVRDYLVAAGRLVKAAFLLIGLGIALATVSVQTAQQWHDGPNKLSSATHRMPELDYALLWAAGKMASNEQAENLYDGTLFLKWREKLFRSNLFRWDWIYPPPMILVAIGVSHLPLLSGYLLWTALICGAAAWVLRTAGLSWRVVLLGLLGPPAWRGVTSGQFAPVAAALVLSGLLQSRRAPVRAGLQLALATLKPHLGILAPLLWIAQRRGVSFATAAAGTLALAGVCTLLFGTTIWPAFFHGGGASVRALLEPLSPEGYWGGTASVFWMARSFGASLALSYAVQFLTAATATVAVWRTARCGSELAAAAVTTCVTLLVSPYLYYSDLVGYSVVVAMLAERWGFGMLPAVLWLFPGVSEIFSAFTGKQVLPVFVVLAALLAWREFRACPASGAVPGEPVPGSSSVRSAVH